MNTNSKFKGTGVAIVTPFRKDESIDFKALTNLVNYQIENKTEYIVVLGTTGESVTLTNDEKKAIVDTVIETVNKRVPIVMGIGGNCTRDVISKIKAADLSQIDAVLSVAPYYNKPTQQGIIEHYKLIATASPKPIIMYNVPGRTGMNMTSETTVQLASEMKNIIAMKEASGNLQQIMEIIKNKPKGFEVISGDDALSLPIIALGGIGAISVIANAFPKEFSELVRQAINLNINKAQELQYQLLNLMNLMFVEGSPAGVKAAMAIKGLLSNYVRLPLVPVSKATYDKIALEIKKISD